MDTKLKEELKSIFEGLKLDEASLDKVLTLFENTVESKVKVATEIALNEQDKVYSTELANLMTKLDEKHASRLEQVIESLNENHVSKLKNIQTIYENHYKREFNKFKNNLLKTNSTFLEMYINKVLPQDVIAESVKVKKQERIIAEMKKMLSIDDATSKSVIKEGIIEAGKIIKESNDKIAQLEAEKATLEQSINENKRDILLNQKLESVESYKRESLRKIFKDADINTINENFEYSSNLIDKQRKAIKEELKTKNINEKVQNKEFIPYNHKPSIVLESTEQKAGLTNNMMNDYVRELVG